MSTRIVNAACPHDCPDACSMLVTVTDGVATGVRGDRTHPFTRGSLCAKVNDYERRAYHPDRILHPMRRVGPKGSGRFERISWPEAVETVCDGLRRVTEQWGGEAVLPLSFTGNISLLNGITAGDPFMHRLGATVLERTMCISARSSAWIATVGPAVVDPESIAEARYIVIWGANTLTSNRHLWPFIRTARERGAKLVVIDPYRTRTAAQADWFVPVRPGTDGALALGLAHVIIAEGLCDDEWVEAHTVGFADLAERAAQFDPERVAAVTGIPAEDVRRLARELATEQPAMINVGAAVERYANGGQAFRAIFSLPALTGSWRHVGGGALEMPLWAFPLRWDMLSRPDWIRPGTRVINHMDVGRALTAGPDKGPPVHATVVFNCNPVVHLPEAELVRAGFGREDLFTVVHDLFLTDTARLADVVLPATTALEHFDVTFSWGHLYLQANNPAIEPAGEAVSNTELFRRLAAGMGFDDEWFTLTDRQMAAQALDWESPAVAGLTLDELSERGWARLNVPGAEAPAPYAKGGFPTPSGKVELRSSLIESLGGPFVLPVWREGYTGDVTPCQLDPVPDWVPGPPERFPLTLLTPKAHAFLNSQYPNQARQRASEGAQPVLLSASDAAARGVRSGQRVRVFNELASIEAVADVRDDVVAGAVVCTYGRWRTDDGPTVNSLTRATATPLGNGPSLSDTRVEIELIPAG